MQNFIQKGTTVTLIAPSTLLSGGGFLVGSVFAVAADSAASGAAVESLIEGVFDLPKAATVTPAQGGLAYWDNTAFNVTTVSSANTKIGFFTRAALAADATTRVRLNGAF